VSLNLTTEAIMRAYLFTCDIGRFARSVLLIAQALGDSQAMAARPKRPAAARYAHVTIYL